MYEFPIRYFEDNFIFNEQRNECWACFKLIGYNYDFKSIKGKKNILNSMARFISNIGKEAAIYIVPVSQDVKKHYGNLIGSLDKKDLLYKAAKAHAIQTESYLEEGIKKKGNSNDYKVYVVTKLKMGDSLINDIKDTLKYFIKEPSQAIDELFGTGYKDIYEKDIQMFLKMSNEFLRKQDRRVALKKCNDNDVEWLIRRPFFRGLDNFTLKGLSSVNNYEKNIAIGKKDELENITESKSYWTPYSEKVIKNGEKVIRASGREILTLTEGLIDLTENRFIKIHQDEGTSYQTFLALSHIPDGILFPGNEWLLALQDYPLQTEVIIRISTIDHKQSIRKIEGKKKEIKDQIEHIIDSDDDLPEDLADSRIYANELESELKASRSPVSDTSITFCLSADSREKLEEKVDFIKEIYTDNNFILERPLTDQMKLFMESIPGTERYVRDYIQRLPPRTLAGGIIGATRLLGDNIGPYIGTTGVLQKNVYLDVSRATKLNRSASGGFYGTLGGGKSFAANLLFYLSVLYGANGLVLDPKGERSNWIDDLPEFKDQINIITLSSAVEDKGKLDPFLIYRDNLEEAAYLAISILSELFNITPKDDEYIAALEAIEWVKKQENPSMLKLADRLMSIEDIEIKDIARKLGRKISMLKNMAMAGLLFGDGTEQGLDFKKKINVLQIQNLNMPDPNKPKDEYTQEEVLSTVLMLPIASFARKFIHQDRRIFKIVLFDEAWALDSTSTGKQMMNALIREGRALNSGCFFISQSTKDMRAEGVKTNISYKFCFKATEINEIRSVLEFLDLEETEENIDIVRSLENGHCLFQDLDGRVGILKFDAVFEHLIYKAFNTNPDKVENDEYEEM
ncbi:ATP-binding protein [Clostridium hydrogeniformans]|uniref:ATP-binding protein n=1 Tax=Clostridium hydrogeniformans TaxID=349933 RepID=UPI0004851A5A|nr:ATP-binding protein [Clostridium hydrogeniformans]